MVDGSCKDRDEGGGGRGDNVTFRFHKNAASEQLHLRAVKSQSRHSRAIVRIIGQSQSTLGRGRRAWAEVDDGHKTKGRTRNSQDIKLQFCGGNSDSKF